MGSIFAADGDHKYDVTRRIALAMSRCGALRHVFDSKIPVGMKIKLYKVAITSLLAYGSEAWRLDERTRARINVRCLARFTDKTNHEEASSRTRTFDLVYEIRLRRFRWLGHLLRLKGERLVKLALNTRA